MNRNQRACVIAGFFSLFVSLLFAPTHPYRSTLVRYNFLFTGQGSVDFGRLFVEWVLIALVTGGLFYLLRGPDSPKSETRTSSVPASYRNWHRLFSIALCVVIAALCATSYGLFGKVRRLEAGIQDVKAIQDSEGMRSFIPVTEPPLPKGAIPIGFAPLGTVNGVPVYTAEQASQMVYAEYDRVVGSAQRVVSSAQLVVASKEETLKRIREELDKLN